MMSVPQNRCWYSYQLESLSFSLQAAFDKAAFKNWMVKGRLAGTVKSAAGLTFVEVEEAGHMVPLNQPLVVRQRQAVSSIQQSVYYIYSVLYNNNYCFIHNIIYLNKDTAVV